MRLTVTVVAAVAGAAWVVSDKMHGVGVDLRQEVGKVGDKIGKVESDLRRFEGATTATLHQHSAQLAQLLQLALDKK